MSTKEQNDKDESATPRTGWWVEFQRGWWKQGLGPAKDRGLKEQSSAIYHGSVTDEQAKELEHIFRDYLETRAQPPRLTAYGMRDFIARAIAYWKSESGERAEREAAELVAMLEHDGRKQSATLALATEKGLTPTGQRIADLERDAARYRWLRDASSWLGFQWYDDARRLQEFNRSAGRPEMIDEKIDEQLSTSYVPGSIK